MSLAQKIILAFAMLALAALVALQTGFARWAFFEMFARIKGVEVHGSTVVRVPPHDSPYQRWLEEARGKLPIYEGLEIDSVHEIALEPWPAMGEGVEGLYLRFADYQITDGRLLEIPVNGRTAPQRHLYEKGIYFMGDAGHTVLRQEGTEDLRVDWREGSLLSIPLNVEHWHVNDSGEPVRLLAISSFPFMLNAVNSQTFIEDNPHNFTDRYDGGADFLERFEDTDEGDVHTNFIDDILEAELRELDYRGKGNRSISWAMAGQSVLNLHISRMPPRMYKKAHRHSSDAFILLLSGEGFSLTWPEGGFHRRHRVDWRAGTLFVPPTYWYHQHLNTGDEPASYLVINAPVLVRNIGLRFLDQLEVDLPEVKEEWNKAIEKESRPH